MERVAGGNSGAAVEAIFNFDVPLAAASNA
jgi:hypothetical protein